MSCVCVNAFHTGLLSVEEAVECADKLQKIVDKHPQVSCILRFHCKFKFKFFESSETFTASDSGDLWKSDTEA